MSEPIKLLLIEDNDDYAELMKRRLTGEDPGTFLTERVSDLQTGIARLSQGGIDLVLLDLTLPDSHGIDTLIQLQNRCKNVPILVLTGVDDRKIAIEAVRSGAQDYLVKGESDGKVIFRIIAYALERHRMQEALRNMALVDQLTGLYNRHGLQALAEQQIKLAIRTKREFLFLLFDVDGLKHINDTLGHLEGDQALVVVAKILRKTFRDSDIVARIGGDEFAVLAVEALKSGEASLLERLGKNMELVNAENKKAYQISFSSGVTSFDPAHPQSMDLLIQQADRVLYQNKRTRKPIP